MITALTTIIISFFATSLLIVPFIDLLYKLKFFKKKTAITSKNKNAAVTHIKSKVKTPEGAGLLLIGILIFLFPAIFALFYSVNGTITSNFPIAKEIGVIIFSLVAFGLLGLVDDIIKFFDLQQEKGFSGLKTKAKLLIQAILALSISSYMYYGLGINFINIPLIGTIHLGPLFIIFASFVIITFSNAVNFTDGVDGLSMGILLFCLFGYLVITVNIIDTPLSTFIGIWIGTIIAFLYFNVYPANIFLGDVGALSFGATLATIALLSGKVFIIFIFGLLFFIEFTSSFIQLVGKAVLKRKILPVAPAHYFFLQKGWKESQLTQRAWLATIILVIIGLFLSLI